MRLRALMCSALLLAGCALPPSGSAAPLAANGQRSITLAVSNELATLPSKPLEALIKVAQEASSGTLEIKLEPTDDPLSSLDGGAELALLSNEVAAMANADFNAFSSPYYFRDYHHYAMTLGTQSFSALTDEKNISLLGAKPLGALYMGSYVMVNGRPTPLTDLDGFREGKITIADNPPLAYVLGGLGIKVMQKQRQEIIDGFNAQAYSTIECRKEDLIRLEMPEKSQRILVSDSFHRVDLNWIMLSDQAAAELSALHLAALTEGVAAAVAHNDRYYLDKEQEGLEHIYTMPYQVEPCSYSVFTAYAADSLRSSARYSNLWNWELYDAVKNLLYS